MAKKTVERQILWGAETSRVKKKGNHQPREGRNHTILQPERLALMV